MSNGEVSPYLQKPLRSRIEAAYDLAPELREAVEALDQIKQETAATWIADIARTALTKIEQAK